MSGARIRRATLAAVAASTPNESLQATLSIAVELCETGFLQFIYEAGLDAALTEAQVERRGVPIALQYASVQLCDDLSDGDCDYLSNPPRTGPLVLMLLQNLFLSTALAAKLSPAALGRATTLFAKVGTGQHEELATSLWTQSASQQVAASVTGFQLAAYLELLWDKTPLSQRALEVGLDMGTLAHIATDTRTQDERFWSLSARSRAALTLSAQAAGKRLARSRLPCVRRAVADLLPALRAGTG